MLVTDRALLLRAKVTEEIRWAACCVRQGGEWNGCGPQD